MDCWYGSNKATGDTIEEHMKRKAMGDLIEGVKCVHATGWDCLRTRDVTEPNNSQEQPSFSYGVGTVGEGNNKDVILRIADAQNGLTSVQLVLADVVRQYQEYLDVKSGRIVTLVADDDRLAIRTHVGSSVKEETEEAMTHKVQDTSLEETKLHIVQLEKALTQYHLRVEELKEDQITLKGLIEAQELDLRWADGDRLRSEEHIYMLETRICSLESEIVRLKLYGKHIEEPP